MMEFPKSNDLITTLEVINLYLMVGNSEIRIPFIS